MEFFLYCGRTYGPGPGKDWQRAEVFGSGTDLFTNVAYKMYRTHCLLHDFVCYKTVRAEFLSSARLVANPGCWSNHTKMTWVAPAMAFCFSPKFEYLNSTTRIPELSIASIIQILRVPPT